MVQFTQLDTTQTLGMIHQKSTPAGISFTRLVNCSVDWVRSVNTTASVVVGYYYTAYEYSKLYSDEYGGTLLVATSANNFLTDQVLFKHMVPRLVSFLSIQMVI